MLKLYKNYIRPAMAILIIIFWVGCFGGFEHDYITLLQLCSYVGISGLAMFSLYYFVG